MSPRVGLDHGIIVRAAAAIADESGLNSVTLATLAQRLNVRSPSLYNHVDGLPGVMALLTLHGLQQLLQMLETAAQQIQSKTKDVMPIAEAYAAFAVRHPGVYEATQRPQSDQQHPEAAEVSGRIVQLVSGVIRSHMPEHASDAEVIHAVRGFRSLLHGYTSLSNAGGFGMPISINDSFQYMIRAYLAGISTE